MDAPIMNGFIGGPGTGGRLLGELTDGIVGGLGLKGVKPIAPYTGLDPTGRNVAISMLGGTAMRPDAGGPDRRPIQVASEFDARGGDYGQTRGLQRQFIGGELAGAMRGAAPSVAELQLQQGQEANARTAFALANSGRGNASAAQAAALNQAAMGGQQVNQQQAILRAGEMAQARQQYAQALQALGGQDMQQQQVGTGFGLQAGMANQAAGLQYGGMGLQARAMQDAQQRAALSGLAGYDQMLADNYFRPLEANAGIQAQNNAQKGQFWGSILGAGTGILTSGMAGGGGGGGGYKGG